MNEAGFGFFMNEPRRVQAGSAVNGARRAAAARRPPGCCRQPIAVRHRLTRPWRARVLGRGRAGGAPRAALRGPAPLERGGGLGALGSVRRRRCRAGSGRPRVRSAPARSPKPQPRHLHGPDAERGRGARAGERGPGLGCCQQGCGMLGEAPKTAAGPPRPLLPARLGSPSCPAVRGCLPSSSPPVRTMAPGKGLRDWDAALHLGSGRAGSMGHGMALASAGPHLSPLSCCLGRLEHLKPTFLGCNWSTLPRCEVPAYPSRGAQTPPTPLTEAGEPGSWKC